MIRALITSLSQSLGGGYALPFIGLMKYLPQEKLVRLLLIQPLTPIYETIFNKREHS